MIEYIKSADISSKLKGELRASYELSEVLIIEGRKGILNYIKQNYKSMDKEKVLSDVKRIFTQEIYVKFKNYVLNKDLDEFAISILDEAQIVANNEKNYIYDSVYKKIGASSLKEILKSYVIYVSGKLIESKLDEDVRRLVRGNYIEFCGIILKTLRQYITKAFKEVNPYEIEALGHIIKDFVETVEDYRKFVLNV